MTFTPPTLSAGPRRSARRRRFTLIELISAMAVFVILMLVLLQFFSAAEKAWTTTNANTEVFESARIAFDVISRDLKCAAARKDDIPGRDITFRLTNNSLQKGVVSNGVMLEFESSTVSSSAAGCDLALVSYQYRHENPTLNLPHHSLQRVAVGSNNALWADSVYNPTAKATVGYPNGGTWETVIDNVLEARMFCLDANMNPAATSWTSGTELTTLPYCIVVNLTLMDRKNLALWDQLPSGTPKDNLEKRAARTFTKYIFLKND